MYPIITHIYAFRHDDFGNVMPICRRLEFCVNNECVAVLESTVFDPELFYQYYSKGSAFLVFPGMNFIRIGKQAQCFTYDRYHKADVGPDRFDLAPAVWCEMLKKLAAHHDWYIDAVLETIREQIPSMDSRSLASLMHLAYAPYSSEVPT